MASQEPIAVERLIEQAHLAMLRQQNEAARTLLQQALALDPANSAALRLLATIPETLPAPPAPLSSGPMEGSTSNLRTNGEPSDEEAAMIAMQAAAQERARLNALDSQYGLSPLYRGGFFGFWDNPNARYSLSDALFSAGIRRLPAPVRCVVYAAIGAVIFALPAQFGINYWVLDPYVGAAVGLGIALWTIWLDRV